MKSILSIAVLASVFAISGCDNSSNTESNTGNSTETHTKAAEQPPKQVTKEAMGQGPRTPEHKSDDKVTASDDTHGNKKERRSDMPVKEHQGSSPESINLWKEQWKVTQKRMEAETKKSKEPQIIIIKK